MSTERLPEHQIIWQKCLDFIKDNVPDNIFHEWFLPIKSISLADNVLTVVLPGYVFYEWMETHASKILKTVIKKEIGTNGKLAYKIVMAKPTEKKPITITLPFQPIIKTQNPLKPSMNPYAEGGQPIPDPRIVPGLRKLNIPSNLIESLNFDNFVEGSCNQFARVVGQTIAKSAPGTTPYNPFFIYSATGLGKTHLAHAIGLEIKANFPDRVVLYVNSDLFYQQYIESVKNNTRNDFINFYQNVDVLIIDDIHFLSKKEKTQEIFFQIFNYLQQRKKQIIITADKSPAEITGFEPRVISRFKWSLVTELQPPDLETRIAILNKKLENDGVVFSKDVIEYLALRVTSNVRELEGARLALLAQASINKKDITIDIAKEMIDKYVKSTSKEISIEYIQKIVSDYFGIAVETINTSTRKREIAQPRQICMFFAKKYTKLPLSTIGLNCGNKDHATVLHACRVIGDLYDTDKKMKLDIDEIEKRIKM
ncbi:MAG TPA: chromosomal replication initiator protein DnaA [Bacteroidales bacterium]|nr:chromosomal replication initiator protein DnaA [Bacteroidales bacterium]